MYNKETLVNYFTQLITNTNQNDIRSRIDDKDLRLFMRDYEHQYSRDIEALYDLYIRKGDQRIVLATVQGNESAVNILVYKVENNHVSKPFSISLYSRRLAELVHNKRVELTETSVHNTVNDIMNFIEGRGDIL